MKVRLWLQRPPRESWVLRVIHETNDGTAIVRTWFNEYPPTTHPPPSVTVPIALACARLARAALEGQVESKSFSVEMKS